MYLFTLKLPLWC